MLVLLIGQWSIKALSFVVDAEAEKSLDILKKMFNLLAFINQITMGKCKQNLKRHRL